MGSFHIVNSRNSLFGFPIDESLDHIYLFREITQLGFKLVSASSSGQGGDYNRNIKPSATDRWIFTRAIKMI